MPTLPVPGAMLDYRIFGDGPLLVLIAGARGSGAIYHPLAQHLSQHFRVLTYDRRGYGASLLDGPQDYDVRLQTDAGDVARLIAHEGTGPALVFGSSSGAIVALQVLTRHAESVRLLLAHEPPALSLLADAEREREVASLQDTYDLYYADGLRPAIGKFLVAMMSASDRRTLAAAAEHGDAAQTARDFDYWFEHELRQYPPTTFDIGALPRANLAFIAGQDSGELLPHHIATAFAARLGAPLHVLPGGHVGYLTYPAEFAQALAPLLRGSDPERS
ncbi:alpha/beta fold hydrolase [Lichenicoccus sp.]|uniref:alpha/beta fold hydrolase n=1 Tax=Lichenicoccus sp. TaxID=2781899 RepID=UPI003D0BF4EE